MLGRPWVVSRPAPKSSEIGPIRVISLALPLEMYTKVYVFEACWLIGPLLKRGNELETDVLAVGESMGILLAVHLGFVLVLFLLLPYSKFVHAVYRFAALLQNVAEERAE